MTITAEENVFGARRGVVAGTPEKKTSGIIGENMPAGVVVVKGAGQVLNVPTSAAEVARACGGLIYQPGKLQYDDGLEWRENDQATVLQKGEMYLIGEEAMAAGADVYVRFAANGALEQLGTVRSDVDNDGDDDTAARLPNARVAYDTSDAGPVIVSLNLPA